MTPTQYLYCGCMVNVIDLTVRRCKIHAGPPELLAKIKALREEIRTLEEKLESSEFELRQLRESIHER